MSSASTYYYLFGPTVILCYDGLTADMIKYIFCPRDCIAWSAMVLRHMTTLQVWVFLHLYRFRTHQAHVSVCPHCKSEYSCTYTVFVLTKHTCLSVRPSPFWYHRNTSVHFSWEFLPAKSTWFNYDVSGFIEFKVKPWDVLQRHKSHAKFMKKGELAMKLKQETDALRGHNDILSLLFVFSKDRRTNYC